MSEPLAWLDGRFVPAAEAVIPVTDAGFILGVTVAEQLRTFGGRLFRLGEHLARLRRSLEIVGVEPPIGCEELAAVACELARRNHGQLDPADDLGLAIAVTPGDYLAFAPHVPPRPRVVMHTYALPFHLWADKYATGESLATTAVRQVPAACWPAELKCRSRMHYYLADREAQARHPGTRAVLLDGEGRITETATANILVAGQDGRLLSPRRVGILPGISLEMVGELAAEAGSPVEEGDLWPADVGAAREVLLASTPFALLPVTRFDGRPIGDGRPGPLGRHLLSRWGEQVGVDIAGQALRLASRLTTAGS
jgi:branched-subunit amino acid aminotransferase/4-amino-4-deoxychorismate lyase